MTFHISQLKEKSKGEILEVWDEAVKHMDAQDKRIAELEKEAHKALGWIATAMMQGLANVDCSDELLKIQAKRDLEQQGVGYVLALKNIIDCALADSDNNGDDTLLNLLSDVQEKTDIFDYEKQPHEQAKG